MTETRELVRLLGTRFVQRRDVKAWQHDNGAWTPDKTPFTMQDFEDHLEGRKTLGHYMVDKDDTCKLFAFDIDFVKDDGTPDKGPLEVASLESDESWMMFPREIWLLADDDPRKEALIVQIRCLADGLAYRIHKQLDIPVAIANSGGKGLHVYGFTGTLPAQSIRELALGILDSFGVFSPSRGQNFYRHNHSYRTLEIEVFPKQGSLEGKEFGNLMKLPLGINRKTGNRSDFIRNDVGYNRLFSMDPSKALSGDLPWEP